MLAAGEELQELQNTGFFTSGPTILVGTMFDHTRIVQVHANAVMLLTAGNFYSVVKGRAKKKLIHLLRRWKT